MGSIIETYKGNSTNELKRYIDRVNSKCKIQKKESDKKKYLGILIKFK